jgi:hypothetical protein
MSIDRLFSQIVAENTINFHYENYSCVNRLFRKIQVSETLILSLALQA